MGCTRVGYILACKYQTKEEVTDCDKHSSLLLYEINNSNKIFFSIFSTGPGEHRAFENLSTSGKPKYRSIYT